MGFISSLSNALFQRGNAREVRGSIYDFKIQNLQGKEVDFSRYRGKALLIVNTASRCGFTPQYAQLEELHRNHGDKVTVLGFPANNFMWQEPGSDQEIASFCERNYGVTFPMFSKISVKGRDAHPLFKWLEAKSGKQPTWNFCKYLVSPDGEHVRFFPSKVSPMDPELLKSITG